jgi:hypothetical protein
LVIVNVILDGLVDHFVHPFTAAICFRMVGCQHLQFDASKLMEGSPHVGGEEWVLIRDDVKHQTILAVPFIENYHSNLSGGVHGVHATMQMSAPSRSIMVRMVSFPLFSTGSGPMKLRATVSKGLSGTGSG